MSYRAILSITNKVTGANRDFTMHLDEDFTLGERIAHEVAKNRTYDQASRHAENTFVAGTQYSPRPKLWVSPNERGEWIAIYADERWDITFEEDGKGFSLVIITGYDGGGQQIFMRRSCYHIGEGN